MFRKFTVQGIAKKHLQQKYKAKENNYRSSLVHKRKDRERDRSAKTCPGILWLLMMVPS